MRSSNDQSAIDDPLARYVAEHAARWTDELRELCAIPSEATEPQALEDAATWCEQRLRAAAFETRRVGLDGVPPLVVGEAGTGERTLIGVQHYDVQPAVPLELWTTAPYEPTVRDGAIYARGVDDNKGHLLLRIQAAEAYRAVHGELPIRLRFLIEGEEESGSTNLQRLLDTDPRLTEGHGALKEGGAIDAAGRPQLLLGGKGISYVELRVRTLSQDAHSGAAPYLPNAAWRLVDALATLLAPDGRILIEGFYDDVRPPTDAERQHVASLPFDADEIRRIYGLRDLAFGRDVAAARLASQFEPTGNICGIVSGFIDEGSKTVIPALASCKIDFRLVPDQDPARIPVLLRAHLDRHGFDDVEVISKEGTRPYRGRWDDPLVRATAAAAEAGFGMPGVLLPTSGGTSPMWTVCHRLSLPNVSLGMSHPGAGAHAPNEHILLDNYWKALRATVMLYGRYATQA